MLEAYHFRGLIGKSASHIELLIGLRGLAILKTSLRIFRSLIEQAGFRLTCVTSWRAVIIGLKICAYERSFSTVPQLLPFSTLELLFPLAISLTVKTFICIDHYTMASNIYSTLTEMAVPHLLWRLSAYKTGFYNSRQRKQIPPYRYGLATCGLAKYRRAVID